MLLYLPILNLIIMWSKKSTLPIFISLFFIGITSAQFTGKPQYKVTAKRNGVSIGDFTLELFPKVAPKHARNFDSLVSKAFYEGTLFHRVIPGFMIQGGDGGISPTVKAEFNKLKHIRGTLSAARSTNINSATSQFFVCVATAAHLNGQYSNYGRVVSGMSVVDNIVNSPTNSSDKPLQDIKMYITYIGSNDSVPDSPVLKSPLSGTQNVGVSQALTWSKVQGALLYKLEVSTDSLFSTLFYTNNVLLPDTIVKALQPSTKYYWRVLANNGGNLSASPVWSFTTTMNTAINNLSSSDNGFVLHQNNPNPTSGQTSFNYFVPYKETVLIKLFDMTGKEIQVLVNEQKEKGQHQTMLDLSMYPVGMYFYQIYAGEFTDTKKIILEK